MIKKQLFDGLWAQNPGLIQLLGLCPTLAVTTNITNGVALGLATVFVMVLANSSIAPIRKFVPDSVRVPIFVLIIASLVTIVDYTIHALSFPLYQALGIFIPLIVTNCIVLARVESFASKNSVKESFFDALFMGLGLTIVLIIIGLIREILSQGTIFQNIEFLLGDEFAFLTIHIFEPKHQFLLASLPPGAFIALAFLVAGSNLINKRK